jgi:hypothetical protein
MTTQDPHGSGKQPDAKDTKGKPGQQQQQSGTGKQYGEGSYSGTRQYNEGMKEHVQNHDIEREARDAAPRSDSEEKEMEAAERIGRSKSKGEGAPPDGEAGDDDAQEQRDIEK